MVAESISNAERKKEALSQINAVIENFKKIKQQLLDIINSTNNPNSNLITDFEKSKAEYEKRTNNELHLTHKLASESVNEKIQAILNETNIKTRIITSMIGENIDKLGKHLKTLILIEIITSTNENFRKVKTPIKLEKIQSDITKQIQNIENRISEAENIYKVVNFLNPEHNAESLDKLINFIIEGKNYDEINNMLKEDFGIVIEEIEITGIKGAEEERENESTKINTPNNSIQQPKSKKGFLSLLIEILSERYNTDLEVGWIQAIKNVLKKRKAIK